MVVRDPEAFSWRYPNVDASKIFGPYDGSLNNAGERLELSMPGDVDETGEADNWGTILLTGFNLGGGEISAEEDFDYNAGTADTIRSFFPTSAAIGIPFAIPLPNAAKSGVTPYFS